MKVSAIGGVPASGKTTLMRLMMTALQKDGLGFDFKEKLVVGTEFPKTRSVVLGDYTAGGTFDGTDRLSMAVQPQVFSFIERAAKGSLFDHVLFEGDRLFTGSLFQMLQASPDVDLRIYVLTIDDEIQEDRFEERGTNQPEAFLRGRKTKIANIEKSFPVTRLVNKTKEDGIRNGSIILGEI